MGREDASEPDPGEGLRPGQGQGLRGAELSEPSAGAPAGEQAKRVLGVDLGLKRTGLALSDPLGISVRPLENLTPKSRAEDVAYLVALCAEHDVEAVVIGHPRMPRSGQEGAMARRARGFAEALAGGLRGGMPEGPPGVFLVDETGSSREAARRLVESGVKRSRRKAALDSEAARVLVQAFLEGERGEQIAG